MPHEYSSLDTHHKQVVRKILENGKPYLANNELIGFYAHTKDFVDDDEELKMVGYVTEFIEDCGIDTVRAMLHKGVIPACYSCYAPTPPSLIEDGCLNFRGKVQVIGPRAFLGSEDFEAVDLRGVLATSELSFGACTLDTVITDHSLVSVDLATFAGSDIKEVWVLKGCQDRVRKKLLPAIQSTNYTPIEKIEWVEF